MSTWMLVQIEKNNKQKIESRWQIDYTPEVNKLALEKKIDQLKYQCTAHN